MGFFNVPHVLIGHKGQIFKSMPKHLFLEDVADCSLDEITKFLFLVTGPTVGGAVDSPKLLGQTFLFVPL
jgi:hypothetical protein